MITRFTTAALVAFTLTSTALAETTTIDFEDVAPSGGMSIINPYSENGFILSHNAASFSVAIFDSANSTVFPINTNGTDIFVWCGHYCGIGNPQPVITLAKEDGGLFSLLSFDYAPLVKLAEDEQLEQGIELTGFLSDGGTKNTTVNLNQPWQTAELKGFKGLTRVEFTSTDFPGFDLAIDNLVVKDAVTKHDTPDNNADRAVGKVFAENAKLPYVYEDSDSDGFGNANVFLRGDRQLIGWVSNSEDCDDTDGNNYPGNTEVSDALDNDCDGSVDEEF